MYINEVVRRVRNYYPNEYDLSEHYNWCDEVSAMLLIEDRCSYKSIILPVENNGTFLLPEDVNIEYIENVTAGRVTYKKEDARTMGAERLYVKGARRALCLPVSGVVPPSVRVDYLVPYTPIRLPKYIGTVEFFDDGSGICLPRCEFITGDTINIDVKDELDRIHSYNEIPLMNVYLTDDSFEYCCITADGMLSDVLSDAANGVIPTADNPTYDNSVFIKNTTITRCVTDKTVCDPPFDTMYIDYLLAKVNLYQRDISAYNQHMTAFNSRLAAYKKWLISRMPKDDGKLNNWW